MMSINLNDITILNIKDLNYCCIVSGITESEVVSLLQDASLTKKLRNKIYIFQLYLTMDKENYNAIVKLKLKNINLTKNKI